MEVQRAISDHLAHANYQAVTPNAVQNRFLHIRQMKLNQRVLKRGLDDVRHGVYAGCPFPSFEEYLIRNKVGNNIVNQLYTLKINVNRK